MQNASETNTKDKILVAVLSFTVLLAIVIVISHITSEKKANNNYESNSNKKKDKFPKENNFRRTGKSLNHKYNIDKYKMNFNIYSWRASRSKYQA